MSGNMVLNVEILGEFKKLTNATNGASKNLKGLDNTVGKISKSMKTALGAIGLGFSLSVVINQLKESSKAAIEDSKSQELLALSLRASTQATDNQIDAVEKIISKYQLQASVADDQLRPAFAKLTQSTGDLEESSKLLGIALDVSAGSGKSLDAVTQAMSRALNGSTGALERLLPAVKGVDDPIAFLAERFNGAAEAASNTDPYQRMNILFGELQEQVGMALLPYLQKFSEWLAEPGTTEMIQDIVKVIVDMIKQFGIVIGQMVKYKDVLVPIVTTVGLLTVAWKAYNVVSALSIASTTSLGGAMTKALGPIGLVLAALQAIDFVNKSIQANGGWTRTEGNGAVDFSGQSTAPVPSGVQGNMFMGNPSTTNPPTTKPNTKPPTTGTTSKPPVIVNQNITVNSASTNASGIVSSLQGYQNQTGANLRSLLR
jgi:hypothetical protein